MAIVEPLSINIAGMWSPVQARNVIARLLPETQARRIKLEMLDISTFDRPKRVLISVRCAYHDSVINPESVCPKCLEETHGG